MTAHTAAPCSYPATPPLAPRWLIAHIPAAPRCRQGRVSEGVVGHRRAAGAMSRRPQREPPGLAPHLDGMQVRVNNVPRKPAPTASAPIVPVLAQMLNHGRRLPPEPKGGTNDEAADKAEKREKDLITKVKEQQKGLRKKEKRIQSLQGDLAALEAEAQQHDLRAAALERELLETRERLEEKEAEFQAAKALQAEAVRVQGEMQSMEAEVQRLEGEAAEFRAEAAAAQMRLQEENGRVAELEGKLARLSDEKNAASEAAARELASVRAEKQSVELRNQVLNESLAQEKDRADLADESSDALRAEAERWQREYEALSLQQERVHRATAVNAQRRAHQDERIKELEEELRQARELVRKQQERLVDAEQKALEMSAASDQLQKAMSAEVDAAQATASSHAQQNLELQTTLRTTSAADRLQFVTLQSDVDRWYQKYEEQKRLHSLKERECEEANRESKGAWEQVRAVNAQLEDKQREHTRLTYELELVRAELAKEQRHTVQLSERVEHFEQEAAEEVANVQSLEEQLKRQSEELARAVQEKRDQINIANRANAAYNELRELHAAQSTRFEQNEAARIQLTEQVRELKARQEKQPMDTDESDSEKEDRSRKWPATGVARGAMPRRKPSESPRAADTSDEESL